MKQRVYRDADGSIRMLRGDKQAVFVTPSQYQNLITCHNAAVLPVNKRLRWNFTLTIPVLLLALSISHSTGLDDAIDRLPQPFPTVLLFGLLVWWPALALSRHWRSMRVIHQAVDARLMDLPVAPPPPPRPVLSHTLEIIALFAVGPGLLIDIIGSMFPHEFDRTPWMGRSIGPGTIVGLVILAILVSRRVAIWRDSRAGQATAGPTPPFADDRMAKLVGRARSEESGDGIHPSTS